jgi:hypothetical protein
MEIRCCQGQPSVQNNKTLHQEVTSTQKLLLKPISQRPSKPSQPWPDSRQRQYFGSAAQRSSQRPTRHQGIRHDRPWHLPELGVKHRKYQCGNSMLAHAAVVRSNEVPSWADTKDERLSAVFLQVPAGAGVQSSAFKTRMFPVPMVEVSTARIRFHGEYQEAGSRGLGEEARDEL